MLEYAGKDVEDIMEDPDSHSHSDSAFELLQDWQIGVVGGEENTWCVQLENSFHLPNMDI